ncbi:phosphatase PAP2/dual specificity phosphatase family protein [Pseudomonas sp. GCM10022188]|uniref:phosphatase PAP2/dual specificity phosphatase family protein n=1 Tax=Pseudomonas TaxID=286 RepID=UPI001E56A5FB|nr:phosphatase PAP2/dual specificity phosphatase family protein [Pseudomonas oryzagri]MCC6074047.1 phosphatase PAP2/dual specificity phosphatase family protein [Pseudomonas oryzagri]
MAASSPVTRQPGLWRRALAWLLLLGPFFFASYGLATWVSAQRSDVGSLVFAWEVHMPFWAWTIVPYWSIDLLYGLSLLVCSTRRELDGHARRLLTAQVVAVGCFLLFPLRFTFPRPEIDGLFGLLFELLGAFDKPFNQAPSLHIALLVILWVCFARHVRGAWRWLLHGWFALIGLSVLTTWQHHFIDLPSGALLGWLCVWLWPLDRPGPLSTWQPARDARRRSLALGYALGAALCALPAFALGGAWLWLLWPAVSLLLVALNYALLGAAGFQKGADGRLSSAALWLLAPYLAAAWLNSRLWTRRRPEPDAVVEGIWLGRIPSARELARGPFTGVIDLCAELPLAPGLCNYRSLPQLDLVAPSAAQCLAAAEAIESARRRGPILVCCALGYSRSATAVAAWLLHSGRARDVDSAIEQIRRARPQVMLGAQQRLALAQLAGSLRRTLSEGTEAEHAG